MAIILLDQQIYQKCSAKMYTFVCNDVHVKSGTFVWKVFLISLYFKHFNNFNWKCIL